MYSGGDEGRGKRRKTSARVLRVASTLKSCTPRLLSSFALTLFFATVPRCRPCPQLIPPSGCRAKKFEGGSCFLFLLGDGDVGGDGDGGSSGGGGSGGGSEEEEIEQAEAADAEEVKLRRRNEWRLVPETLWGSEFVSVHQRAGGGGRNPGEGTLGADAWAFRRAQVKVEVEPAPLETKIL